MPVDIALPSLPTYGLSGVNLLLSILMTCLIAFLPSLIYMILLRFAEKYDREPWGSLLTVFVWGATLGIILVILVRGFFLVYVRENQYELAFDRTQLNLIAMIIITPLIAELIKPLGLWYIRVDIDEPEDGLIYGACAGLGYAATENLLYGILIFTAYGVGPYIHMVILRSISVVLIHASATSFTGYGLSRAIAYKERRGRLYALPLFFGVAVLLHSIFNYLALTGGALTGNIFGYRYSIVFAIGIAFVSIFITYAKVWKLDRLRTTPVTATCTTTTATATTPTMPPTQPLPPSPPPTVTAVVATPMMTTTQTPATTTTAEPGEEEQLDEELEVWIDNTAEEKQLEQHETTAGRATAATTTAPSQQQPPQQPPLLSPPEPRKKAPATAAVTTTADTRTDEFEDWLE